MNIDIFPKNELTDQQKWLAAIVAGFLFIVLSTPMTYQVMNGVTSSFGLNIANKHGCPNMGGVILNSIIFILIIRMLMW